MRFEFQWNSSQCLWYNESTNEFEDCKYLPLTASNNNTAMFEFTMPKRYGDNRDNPLIVVWYDLLSIPYSIRPTLDYEYYNMTLMDVGKGREFGISELWNHFKPALIGAAILIASFIVISLIACLVAGEKKVCAFCVYNSLQNQANVINRIEKNLC